MVSSKCYFSCQKDDDDEAEDKKKNNKLSFLSLPTISLPLPSFSGRTPSVPDILQYDVRLKAQPQLARSIAIEEQHGRGDNGDSKDQQERILSRFTRPLFAMVFQDVEMSVDEPRIHIHDEHSSLTPDASGAKADLELAAAGKTK